MRKLLIFLAPLFLVSCSENHYHDGFYKAHVINPNNIFNSHHEVIKVDGNSITLTTYAFGGDFAGEIILPCKQHLDKIEFEENGLTKVLRYIDSDSSLMLNELTVFKYMGKEGDIIITKAISKPFIKNNNNGTITLLPGEKINQGKIVAPDIKETEEEILIGVYASSELERHGMLNVYKKGNTYTVKESEIDDSDAKEICSGTLRKDGRIIDNAGDETAFKLKKNTLYQMVNGIWIKYDDQTCGM